MVHHMGQIITHAMPARGSVLINAVISFLMTYDAVVVMGDANFASALEPSMQVSI